MKNKIIITIILVLVIAAAAGNVFAAGYTDTYGAGVRGVSLGGAFTAVADDYSAVYANPAGLALIEGSHFYMECLTTKPDMKVQTASGDLVVYDSLGDVRTDPTQALGKNSELNKSFPAAGLVLDLNRVTTWENSLKFGLMICLPEHFDVAYRVHAYPPDQPHFLRYGDEINRVTLAASMGAEVVKDLVYVGGGAQIILVGPASFYVDGLTLSPGNVLTKGEFGGLMKYFPMAGLMITPLDKRLHIGFSWRDEMEFSLGLVPIIATIPVGGMDVNLNINVSINGFYNPEEYSLGAAYYFDRLMVSLEVNKQLWSQYDYSIADSYQYLTETPDFKDTYTYRIGMEYQLNRKVSLLAGYYHQPSPTPDQSGRISNYIDMDKDAFSLGASYLLEKGLGITKRPVKLAAVVQYQMLEDLDINKDGVTGISWVDEESYTVEGNVLAAGISMSVSW